MAGVPDLSRIVDEATRAQQQVMVTINSPDGRSQTVPVDVGIFMMLGDITANLARIATGLEQLVVQNAVQP